MNVSGSTIVITVSRCISARVSGMRSATIRSTSPPANSRRASRSTPAGTVRSLIPISSAPPPRTSMSPPSVVASPFSAPSDQIANGRACEQRVPAVDGLVVRGLAHAGLLAHAVDRDAAVDPRRGVAGVEVVGQRLQHEVVRVEHVEGHRARLGDPVEHLALGDPADEVVGQRVEVHRVEAVAQRVDGQRAVDPLVEDRVEDVRLGVGQLHGRAQQVAEEVHGDVAVAQHVGEAVVLLLGAVHPQHVVEQQAVLVAGGEPFELQPRSVQDHLPERPDLGVNAIHAGRYCRAAGPRGRTNRRHAWSRTPAAASRRSARRWVSRRRR